MILQSLGRFFRDLGYFCSGLLLVALLTLAGCGGGGGSSAAAPNPNGTTSESGQLMIGLTDAEGDFLIYDVTVSSLTLERQNGDVVDALPLATRVDFAELTEVTEFLNIATVPAGNYHTVNVQLDFSDANIVVEDVNGVGVVAQALDAAGNALDVVDLELKLTTSDVINIRPGAPQAFSLDFDLAASNSVDMSANPPVVTVEPFLLATPELETDREHRVRGIVRDVDQTEQLINLAVRPFRHRQGSFGSLDVHVDENTEYEVDGVGLIGADGLAALAALDANAPLQALGQVSATEGERMFTATTVVAGSSVPWADADVLRGVVVGRTDDVLTVGGAHIEFTDGRRAYRGSYTVLLDEDTTVSSPGSNEPTIDSISVGQRVLVWGEFTDDVTLDAERVRMRLSGFSGEVVQRDPLIVDLFALSGRNPQRYDFSGTGMDVDHDADPDSYEVSTGLLPLTTVEPGDLVRGRGLVHDFGQAPPDFNARTVVDVGTDQLAAALYLGWMTPASTALTSLTPARIDVALADARVALKLRGVPRDYLDALTTIALTAPSSGRGVYAVRVRGDQQLHLFRDFADLVDEIMAQLDGGNLLHRITAQGRYNAGQQELVTRRAGFVFVQPGEEG
ncbi:MAG: DUF4382 domain-containing protein [Pseudomonadales bacterium]